MQLKRLLLLLFLLLLAAVPAYAQEGDPAEQLQKELWCPICQGVRLDTCEQKVCEQMREMIDEQLAAGKTPEEIKQQFVEFYGPVVLGEPPREGINWLAWIVPILLVIGGLIFAFWMTRSWSQRAQHRAPAFAKQDLPASDDPYLSQVEQELEDL